MLLVIREAVMEEMPTSNSHPINWRRSSMCVCLLYSMMKMLREVNLKATGSNPGLGLVVFLNPLTVNANYFWNVWKVCEQRWILKLNRLPVIHNNICGQDLLARKWAWWHTWGHWTEMNLECSKTSFTIPLRRKIQLRDATSSKHSWCVKMGRHKGAERKRESEHL